MHTLGLFDFSEHPDRLSKSGDPLEALERQVDSELFRRVPVRAPDYGECPRGGRPPHDAVMMFRVPVPASLHSLGDERMAFPVRDRLSWLRFSGFRIGEPPPDQKTIRLFREKPAQAGAFRGLFAAFEAHLRDRGDRPTGGQVVAATLVCALRLRMTKEQKARAKAGECVGDIWPDDPGKARRRRTRRHVGRSGIPGRARPGRARGMPGWWTLPSPASVTATTSASTAGSGSSGVRRPRMPPALTGMN